MIGQCPIIFTLLPFPIFFENFFKIFIDLGTLYLAIAMQCIPTPYLFILTARLAPI